MNHALEIGIEDVGRPPFVRRFNVPLVIRLKIEHRKSKFDEQFLLIVI
jgi:hypothetical protein